MSVGKTNTLDTYYPFSDFLYLGIGKATFIRMPPGMSLIPLGMFLYVLGRSAAILWQGPDMSLVDPQWIPEISLACPSSIIVVGTLHTLGLFLLLCEPKFNYMLVYS